VVSKQGTAFLSLVIRVCRSPRHVQHQSRQTRTSGRTGNAEGSEELQLNIRPTCPLSLFMIRTSSRVYCLNIRPPNSNSPTPTPAPAQLDCSIRPTPNFPLQYKSVASRLITGVLLGPLPITQDSLSSLVSLPSGVSLKSPGLGFPSTIQFLLSILIYDQCIWL